MQKIYSVETYITRGGLKRCTNWCRRRMIYCHQSKKHLIINKNAYECKVRCICMSTNNVQNCSCGRRPFYSWNIMAP